MEVTRLEPEILGSAVFGTIDGLQSLGNGILTQVHASAGIFEFGIGRSRGGPLHAASSGGWAFFRRQCRLDGRQTFDLIGHLGPCLDQQGRSGYFGSCIACPSDSRDGIHDWHVPYTHALQIFQAHESLIEDGVLPGFSRKPLFRPIEEDVQRDIGLAAQGEVLLGLGHSPSADLGEAIHLMQAAAFMGGAQMNTVILVDGNTQGATPVASPQFREYEREMERTLQRQAQRSADAARAVRARGGAAEPTSSPARTGQGADVGGRAVSQGERIRNLESRLAYLERAVSDLRAISGNQAIRGYASQDRGPAPVSLFEDDHGSMLRRALPWVAGSVVTLATVIVLLIYLLVGGDGVADHDRSSGPIRGADAPAAAELSDPAPTTQPEDDRTIAAASPLPDRTPSADESHHPNLRDGR